MSANEISTREFADVYRKSSSLNVVDVRTPVEFREMHLDGAINVPLDQLSADKVPTPNGEPLYVVCRSGSRGAQGCRKLRDVGLENVVNVEGGTLACDQAGLPMVRGKKTMSLERQVRIAAGTLVVLGVGLSFVHPAFLALSAFVGAGLVFAGITDTCGMGMLLARMPWNQCGNGTCDAS